MMITACITHFSALYSTVFSFAGRYEDMSRQQRQLTIPTPAEGLPQVMTSQGLLRVLPIPPILMSRIYR